MKITHLCLGAFYVDNHSYQENMIPKYHKKLGHEVTIIASTLSFDKDGNSTNVKKGKYFNENNIKVNRLDYTMNIPKKIAKFLRLYMNTYEALEETNPDILFIHGCQFLDMKKVVTYLKNHPDVVVYVDNHADFSNSATNWLSENILHKVIWRRMAQLVEPYTRKFYGVLPARVDFLTDIYKIPKNKVELLQLGVDNEEVVKLKQDFSSKEYRKSLNISENDFLIVTGGKIDNSKKQIFHLIEAIKESKRKNLKLIIFGSVIPELKEKFNDLVNDDKIIFVGWLNNEEIYKLLASSELAIYPGRHSVLWEQTVGLGIPMIVKYWSGTTHIDVGGNVEFIYEDSMRAILNKIEEVLTEDKYKKMKKIAKHKGMKVFSYERIARESIDQV